MSGVMMSARTSYFDGTYSEEVHQKMLGWGIRGAFSLPAMSHRSECDLFVRYRYTYTTCIMHRAHNKSYGYTNPLGPLWTKKKLAGRQDALRQNSCYPIAPKKAKSHKNNATQTNKTMKLIRSFSVRRNSSIKEDAAVSGGAERRKEEVASATKEEHAAMGKTTRRNSVGGQKNDKMMDAKCEAKASAGAETSTTADPVLTVPFETPNEELVIKFFSSPTSGEHHDLSQFFTHDADWLFQDAHMTMPGFLAEMQKVFQSFPDFRFHIYSVQEQPDGVTVLARINAVGTHTGAPFAFGPYPEIQAAGIRVTMDHEYVSPHLLFCVLCVIECV
jgi:hypothetical protein